MTDDMMFSVMGTFIIIVKQLLQALWVVPRELLVMVWILLKDLLGALLILYNALVKAFGGGGRSW